MDRPAELFGQLAGVVAPAVTGYAVEQNGHFFWAFALCSAVVLARAAAYAFLLGRVEPVNWSQPSG